MTHPGERAPRDPGPVDEKLCTSIAERIVVSICESDPDEDTLAAQDRLDGTPQGSILCVKTNVLADAIAVGLADAMYDREIAAQPVGISPEASSEQVGGTAQAGEMWAPGERRGMDSIVVKPMAGADLDGIAAFAVGLGAIERHRIRAIHVTSFDVPWNRRYEIAHALATHPDVRHIETNRLVSIASASPTPAIAPSEPSHADVPREEEDDVLARSERWFHGQWDARETFAVVKALREEVERLRARTQPQEQETGERIEGWAHRDDDGEGPREWAVREGGHTMGHGGCPATLILRPGDGDMP